MTIIVGNRAFSCDEWKKKAGHSGHAPCIFLKQTASPQAQVSGEACQRDGGENEKREGC